MKKLKKRVIFVVFMFLPLFVYANPSQDLNHLLTQAHSLSADFTQKVMDNNTGEALQVSKGHFRLLRPGYLWWQVDTPNQQLILIKQQTLYFYQADLQQLTIKSFHVNAMQTPAALLLNHDSAVLTKNYVIHEKITTGLTILTLIPKSNDQLLKSICLSFKESTLTEIDLVDHLEHATTISFHHVILNPPIAASQFIFNIPKETDVIHG